MPTITKTYKTLDKEVVLEIPTSDPIHIMVSGGMDSALLLYMVAELSNGRNDIITYTVAKTDGAWFHSKSVVSWIQKRFSNVQDHIAVGNPGLEHDMQVRSGYIEAIVKHKAPILYLGENQNPPAEFLMGGMYPNRMAPDTQHPYLVTPFLHLYKTHIAELCKQLELDSLIELTHTCTAKMAGRCNECFACTERAWGFSQIGHQDPSTR